MRDVYHCTPEELRRQRWIDVNETLTVMRIESEVNAFRAHKK